METINVEQGSDGWFAARIGSIGGSSIQSAVAKGEGKTRKSLMYRLIGEILSGVKYEGYCSDLQRTFYILDKGQRSAPADVQRGFDTIVKAIEAARSILRPGARGLEVDKAARDVIVSNGYDEFPHGLGHQVGRFSHDGTALLGPAWEKYARKPFENVEEGMVFTIEPRLTVPDRGVVTIENMVVVTKNGAEYLSTPQEELILIRY